MTSSSGPRRFTTHPDVLSALSPLSSSSPSSPPSPFLPVMSEADRETDGQTDTQTGGQTLRHTQDESDWYLLSVSVTVKAELLKEPLLVDRQDKPGGTHRYHSN